MDIIVIGAGIGGLQAAKTLAEAGHKVRLFESRKRTELAYDWIDDVETKVFEELNIPLPNGHFRTANVTFAPPFSDRLLRVKVDDSKRDWSIERRPFSDIMVERALSAGVELHFETAVDELLFDAERILGVEIKGEKLTADLVIDSSGVYSKFRASLPFTYNIQSKPAKGEVFRAYRAFYAPNEEIATPEDTKIIHLKHLGEDGIAWCVVEPNRDVNVLVGRIDELGLSTLQNALTELRKSHPIMSDKLLRGGIFATIPIRYPITRMVANNYALVGDSAFMTIPLIGSGVANSLRAGQILAETVTRHNSGALKELWEYQYRYYTEIGYAHFSVDIMKRALLGFKGDDIRFLFESGVVSEVELNGIASGEKLTMKLPQIIDKLKRGGCKIGLLLNLVKNISKGEKAEALAKSIPAEFDEKKVCAWQRKLDSMFI